MRVSFKHIHQQTYGIRRLFDVLLLVLNCRAQSGIKFNEVMALFEPIIEPDFLASNIALVLSRQIQLIHNFKFELQLVVRTIKNRMWFCDLKWNWTIIIVAPYFELNCFQAAQFQLTIFYSEISRCLTSETFDIHLKQHSMQFTFLMRETKRKTNIFISDIIWFLLKFSKLFIIDTSTD